MAKFLYRMQNILNIKYKLETQAKTAFSVAAAALQREEEKLEALRQRKRSYELKARELASGKLDFLEIRTNRAAIENMKELIKNQLLAVHVAERNLENARKQLQEVMTERKTHEILKDKAFEEFKKEVEKEESKAVDELVSFTHNHVQEG
ncbi:MAG: flagellar export protein FliJ [Lachnospiraceae bacterium]|nr:flagellar export protein FliJ [Lachnospiraceae bacterium]